jgi:hypothetical protein
MAEEEGGNARRLRKVFKSRLPFIYCLECTSVLDHENNHFPEELMVRAYPDTVISGGASMSFPPPAYWTEIIISAEYKGQSERTAGGLPQSSSECYNTVQYMIRRQERVW